MANINTFPERFRLGRASATPFAALQEKTGIPSTKLEWCPTCRDETDTDTRAHHQGVTYSYRRSCLRCGSVLARGIYHNVPILSAVPLPAGTVEWTTAPGVDRR
jgi:hypothetical protein